MSPPPSCPPKWKWSLGVEGGWCGRLEGQQGLLKVGWESRKKMVHLHRIERGLRAEAQSHGPLPFEVGGYNFESLGFMKLFVFTVTHVFLCSFIVCKVLKKKKTHSGSGTL